MAEVEHETKAAAAPAAAGPAAVAPAGHPLLSLQRSAGNAAVGALLQTKLSVGKADDPAEREADRVAAEVMRTLAGGVEAPPVRRSSGGHDELGGQDVSPDVQAGIQGASGRSMDAGTLTRMESAFGASFSNVRIHDGAEADTLSRTLQAEAFTTGNDVFFRKGNYDPSSSGGQELLAHELTHVVQQGSAGTATRRIRRFVTKEQFATRTDEGTFTTKGPAQKEIEKQLTAYARLGVLAKLPKAHPTGVTVAYVMKPEQYDQALALLAIMKQTAELWLASKTKETTGPDGKTTTTIDPSRAKRGAGMAWFLMAADGEIARLKAQKEKDAAAGGAPVEQDAVTVDASGVQKLKQKYTGNLGDGLSFASTVVGKAIVNDGDSTEFNLDMKIPVQPGIFVGAQLNFEGSRNKGNTELSVEAMFQAGASIGIANIGGALGGYFKASAKTAEGAMKLISYGFYRRCRESEVIPAAIGNKIWGGDSGAEGKKKSEKWSLEVEETELQDEESFVETGAMAQVFAEVDAGPVAEAGAAATAATGTRHDKKSLTDAKGGAGQKNDGPGDDGWFAQAKTGRATRSVELAAKASFLSGTVNGDVKFKLDYLDQLDGKGVTFQGLSVKVRASGRMASAGFEGAIASLVGDVSKTVRLIVSKQFQDAAGTDQALKLAVPGITLAKDSAEITLQNILGISVADAVKKYALEPIQEAGANAINGAASAVGVDAGVSTGGGGGTSAAPTASKVGIEVAITHADTAGGTPMTRVEIRHLTSLDVKVPAILKAELVRRSRLIGWETTDKGSSWKYL